MKSTLRLWFVLSACAWLVCAPVTFAVGEFQQTKDGKTMVWNGTPKPGESASWNGSRDSESYATGFGALTSYNSAGKVYALYYGKMVRGKFEGPVNMHISGHTAHAYFVDGGRVSNWARGPAPSIPPPTVAAVIQKRRGEAEMERAKEAQTKSEAAKITAAAPTPAEKPKPEPEKVRETKSQIATKPAESPSEATPPMPAEKERETAAAATPAQAFEEPATIPTPAEKSTEITSRRKEEPPAAAERENLPQSAPSEHPASVSQATPPSPGSKESEADISLSTLVGPPTSLRTTSETSAPTESESSSADHSGPLTETEAINLADAEARIHGLLLANYERPKVDHSNVKGKWSLFYGLKDQSAKSADVAPFTATVEDKTKKVEIRK